jgi:hypothetical protein
MLRKGKQELNSQVEGEAEKQVCISFKGQIFEFIRDLDALMKDRKLGKNAEYLDRIAHCVVEINQLTESAYMCGEDMEIAASLIQNILTHPLDIQGLPKDAHLLSAAERYVSDKTPADHFSRVMVSCVHHAKATENLLRSLKLIAYDM